MASLSDLIESFIKQMFEGSDDDFLEIQRNELANTFKCAPSQINYVLATRFTTDKGYYIESRRGGGGCIKIRRADIDKNEYIKHAINSSIGYEISQQDAEYYIDAFQERGYITEREAMLMNAVINDKSIDLPKNLRDRLRAKLLKAMVVSIIE